MLAIQITANILLLLSIAVSYIILGFAFRQGQLQKRDKQIVALEKEMLKNHAEIIDLYRQLEVLKSNELKTGATILKLKDGPTTDEQNNLPDVSARKKLLNQVSNRT